MFFCTEEKVRMEVKVFDNITEIARDDMASTIEKGSR